MVGVAEALPDGGEDGDGLASGDSLLGVGPSGGAHDVIEGPVCLGGVGVFIVAGGTGLYGCEVGEHACMSTGVAVEEELGL